MKVYFKRENLGLVARTCNPNTLEALEALTWVSGLARATERGLNIKQKQPTNQPNRKSQEERWRHASIHYDSIHGRATGWEELQGKLVSLLNCPLTTASQPS